jgi:hypothetical protein
MVWECDGKLLHERWPYGHPDRLLEFTRSRLKRVRLGNEMTDTEGTRRNIYYKAWDEIVPLYSQTSMTETRDKLVAIPGVAERMNRRLHDTYLWGLWENKLGQQLLWHVRRPEKTIRHQPPTAPTWSWASLSESEIIPGQSHNAILHHHDVFRLIEARNYSVCDMVESSWLRGELCLKGYLIPVSFTEDPKLLVVGPKEKRLSLSDCEIFFDQAHGSKPAHCFCLPIPAVGYLGYGISGLLLEQLPGSAGHFHRMGIFEVHRIYSKKRSTRIKQFDRFWESCFECAKARDPNGNTHRPRRDLRTLPDI